MERRYVGVLVNQRLFNGINKGKTGHESLHQYVRAGLQYKVTPCFFRLCDIHPGQSTIKAYIASNGGYVRKELPTPTIIHNRAMYQKKSANAKLQRLIQNGATIFNPFTRYGKLHIHRSLLVHTPF